MKAMVGVVVTILVIFSVVLFWPSSSLNDSSPTTTNEKKTSNEAEIVSDKEDSKPKAIELNTPADDLRLAQMEAEYKILERARRDLKQQLARLRYEMWGLKFPVEQAKEINEIMLNAHKQIKNPDLLGAFSDVQGIKDQIDKITFADKALQDVKTMIEAKTQSKDTSE